MSDAEPLQRIAVAFSRAAAADVELAEAVNVARAEGCSWAAISAMMDVSEQTAEARYGG